MSTPLYPSPTTFPGLGAVPAGAAPFTPTRLAGEWIMFARDPGYALNGALPILSAQAVRRHLGVDTAVVQTPFTPEAFGRLQPSCGLELWRDGRQEFAGLVSEVNPTWDATTGQAVLRVQAVGDQQHLADRLTFPDPLRAADDQIVNDYWTYTGAASTAMRQLISDQAGPTCRPERRVAGLVMGADPGVGLVRSWSGLFDSVMDQLTVMSVASGANLGVRMRASRGRLTASIVAPRDMSGSIKFSANLSNLVGVDYRIAAPTVTHALVAGQGELHARVRKMAATSDPLALMWGRQMWSYLDRRDTAEIAELNQAAADALADGGPTVSLVVTLTDSEAATYGTDWDVGDRVTVYVGIPDVNGETRSVATVEDVVREIYFSVEADGSESIRPAIGSFDAKAAIPTPTQQQLAQVGLSLRRLIART